LEQEKKMAERPSLKEFRIEDSHDGIVHLVFDMPGRSMNVFSNSAIDDIGIFAAWLTTSDARGCVVRSGKASAFCAGADLPEIEAAYDMIEAAAFEERERRAFDHFFRLSKNLRALETCGKPVVAAINGLALGGGCELALACHARIMTATKNAQLGLPESLVGLLPGAGGTQRLPRLVDIETALKVLLDGARLDAEAALAKGAADAVVAAGQEVSAAEHWIHRANTRHQPWDRGQTSRLDAVRSRLAEERRVRRTAPNGHFPAPLAILDCIEGGLGQPIEKALVHEMTIFSKLIQRPEPRAMIRALFMGRLDHDRLASKGALPSRLPDVLAHAQQALEHASTSARNAGVDGKLIDRARKFAGFPSEEATMDIEIDARDRPDYWFEQELQSQLERVAADLVFAAGQAVARDLEGLSPAEINAIDYAANRQIQFPGYLGGPLALAKRAASRKH
jgi:3-hydroxyacyl-CoA dehydrogenase/enoyl-CoA hydratase/3-hydroxybutyryl-CoA epimerase